MFGYVVARKEGLSPEELARYRACYCGLCRSLKERHGQLSRLALHYDMTFLILLLASLYEPEETCGESCCPPHPLKKQSWWRCELTDYAADMNVALSYYKALDDVADEGKPSARLMAKALEPHLEPIRQRFPRQCDAIRDCIRELSRLEQANTENPDLPASCFGRLMAELMVWREDQWSGELRSLGFWLGRFVYLADAMLDYDRDKRKKQYNPFLSREKDTEKWEEYLVLAMARCTDSYEKLPLVQDKALLDNILYSGVWVQYRGKTKKEDANG